MRNDDVNRESEIVLDDFIHRFETKTLKKSEWTHAAHLRIGGVYVLAHGQAAALAKLRVGICRLNESHGVINSDTGGYHETLTRFWLAIIGHFLSEHHHAHDDWSRADRIGALIDAFGHRSGLFRDYWSTDLVKSVAARRAWFPPDKLMLDAAGLA
jgi:hypothetical protein